MIFNVGGGGGAALNFRVVGNPKPSNPTENCIWVDTDTPITSYTFSATQPTGVPGMVWITIGTSSRVAFNALKKNGIQVYPISAKQYVSGAWVDKTAKSYQGGAWVGWAICLYNRGNQCVDITGGWNVVKNTNGQVTFNDSSISFGYSTASNTQTNTYTKNKVDVTKFKKITALIDVTVNGGYADELCIGLYNNSPSHSATPIAYGGTTKTGKGIELELNVENYSGSYYIGFKAVGSKGTLYEVKAIQ